jgi:hypothetical protein
MLYRAGGETGKNEGWRFGRLSEESPWAILGAAVRALEALGKEVNEETLLEATKKRGIERWQVRDFLEKAKHGKRRGRYPGYH